MAMRVKQIIIPKSLHWISYTLRMLPFEGGISRTVTTLKQLTGKTAPLQVLKFLNPKPTLIELLAFCDFIAITDINTIVFDNVILTSEMFDTLICSLCEAKDLDKLSLRNVPIDSANWLLSANFSCIINLSRN